MRGDVLSGGTPKRLVQSKGQWSLEVVRQVAIDRSVYRPHSQLLDGPELILRYLKRNPTFHRLADSTLRLLKSRVDEEDASFEAVNGEWIPSPAGSNDIDVLRTTRERAAKRSQYVQLLELRTEHIRLQHAHLALMKKVMALSEQLALHTVEIETLKKQGPVIVQAPAQSLTPQPSAAEPEELPESDQQTPDSPAMLLPMASDLIRCLEQLIGGDATAKETPGALPIAASSSNLFIATLVDDDEKVVGAVVMDLAAAVFLGGTLLMVPEGELEMQVKKRNPSEDSIAASSEVCNSIGGSVNNLPDNIHVRTNFLEPLDFAKQPWLAKPRAVVTLQDTFGGKTALLSR